MNLSMAVALMMFIEELRKNGGETAICRHFLPFLAELDIFESFEAIFFFFKKITPKFLHLTLVKFQISYYSTKKKCSVQILD